MLPLKDTIILAPNKNMLAEFHEENNDINIILSIQTYRVKQEMLTTKFFNHSFKANG
jgi:hypothetical protein